ncbi:MAG: phosphatase PAP2 family protein [Chloroflexota bacterium]
MKRIRLPSTVVLMALAFAVLAVFAYTSATTPGDTWITDRVQSIHDATFARVLNKTSDFATQPLITPMAILCAITAAYLGGLQIGIITALMPCAWVVVPVAKALFERQRPPLALTYNVTDYSFPSGHSFSAMVLYGFTFYVASVYMQRRLPRLFLQAACAWLIIGTGLQRIYIGAHWPSDVAGGFLLAGLFIAGGIALHRWADSPAKGRGRAGKRSTQEAF